jgi:hypothetical protein
MLSYTVFTVLTLSRVMVKSPITRGRTSQRRVEKPARRKTYVTAITVEATWNYTLRINSGLRSTLGG